MLCCLLQDKERILEGSCKMVPSLRHAEVVSDWAGLRPSRDRLLISLEHQQVCAIYHCVQTLHCLKPRFVLAVDCTLCLFHKRGLHALHKALQLSCQHIYTTLCELGRAKLTHAHDL